MFGFFKKDKTKTLQKKYEALLQESFELAKTDRKASDLKRAEAEKVAQELENLKS